MRALIFLVILVAALPRPALAMVGEELAADDRIYDLIDQLRTRGVELTGGGAIRPASRAEIADSLAAIEGRGTDRLTPGVRGLLGLLIAEFQPELTAARDPSTRLAGGALWLRPSASMSGNGNRRGKMALEGETAACFGPHVRAQYRAILDSNGRADSTFIGETWRGRITATSPVSALEVHGRGWRVVAGRSTPAWSPLSEGLLLSGRHPPMDGVRAELRWRPFRLLWQVCGLDPISVRRSELPAGDPDATLLPADDTPVRARRFMSAHRLEWRPRPGLTLGGTEAVLYGGAGRTWEPYYLLPFIPYYSEQWNHHGNDNLMVGLDVDWLPAAGRRISAELLLDDAQYTRHREPQEIATSIAWQEVFETLPGEPRVDFGFTRVNSTVYGQSRPWNRWTYGSAGLGSPLGPDADRWRLEVTALAARRLILGCEGYMIRRGEMRADTPRAVRVPFTDGFPSGVVERRRGALAHLTWFAGPAFRSRAWLGLEDIENESHRLARHHRGILLGADLRAGMQFLRRDTIDTERARP